MSDCPCRYCTKETGRSDICHGICEKYKTWKKNHDERAAQEKIRRNALWSSRTGRWYSKGGHWRNPNLVKEEK